jgi:hypothetical protein
MRVIITMKTGIWVFLLRQLYWWNAKGTFTDLTLKNCYHIMLHRVYSVKHLLLRSNSKETVWLLVDVSEGNDMPIHELLFQ